MKHIQSSDSIVNLAKAMLQVQQVIMPACKDRTNSFTNSKYATLNSVMEACSKALSDAGIWVTQYPVPVESNINALGLVTKLVHAESGEFQSSMLVMPLPKNDPQGYGSALTYARRYALSAMVGIVTNDDDGNLATYGQKSLSNSVIHDSRKTPVHGQNSSGSIKKNHVKNNKCKNLPHIDGVEFMELKAKDGKLYLTASGNTQNKGAILKEAGFKWNPGKKVWYRIA